MKHAILSFFLLGCGASPAAKTATENPQTSAQSSTATGTTTPAIQKAADTAKPVNQTAETATATEIGTASSTTTGSQTSTATAVNTTTALKLSDPTCTDPDLTSVAAGVTFMLCNGTIGTGTYTPPAGPSSCTANAQTGCLTTAQYKSADLTNLTAANIKNGVVVAGVTGQYPSASFKLPGAGGTPGLTSLAATTAAGSYEFWDATGSRVTGSIADAGTITPGTAAQNFNTALYRQFTVPGDANLASANINSGISIFGVAGSLAGSTCSSDGQQNCVVSGLFKAANVSGITAYDLRAGKSLAGLSGKLDFYKGLGDTTVFNRATGTGALAGLDIYDTVPDYLLKVHSSAGQAPGGWDTVDTTVWLRDPLSDTGVGGGTTNGICDGTEDCVYKDQMTGVLWAKTPTAFSDAVSSWESAITYCTGLNYGGYASGWRLPTLKEAMQAVNDGVGLSATIQSALVLGAGQYWTATNYDSNNAYTFSISPIIQQTVKTNSTQIYTICVRP